MDKNVIRPRLYHYATVAHEEEFRQYQDENKRLRERIKELETALKIIAFEMAGSSNAKKIAEQALKG